MRLLDKPISVIPGVTVHVYVCVHGINVIFRPAGRFLFRGGLHFKVRCTIGLLRNKTWMTEYACHDLVSNLLNLCEFLPSV